MVAGHSENRAEELYRCKMIDLWTYLKGINKPIYLYGTGNGADKILDELIRRDITVAGVFASDGFVRNRTFRGFKVISFSQAITIHPNLISLVSFGTQLFDVMDNIKAIGDRCEQYTPDVPVIGNNEVFDIVYARKHADKIKTAYGLLADEKSKKVFENTVMYKLTGKLNYLFEIESDKSEIFDIIDIKNARNYLDLGAYNGDTVDEFISHSPEYESITAVEPDAKNFRKLKSNTQNLNNITLINAGVTDKSGQMPFSMRGGRNSSVGENARMIQAYRIDDIVDTVDYIKIDIEGLEERALLGGVELLKNSKPRLNIAAYHRNEDVFSIPILINKINPDYKIYLRHHPYIPAWDTNYYCY